MVDSVAISGLPVDLVGIATRADADHDRTTSPAELRAFVALLRTKLAAASESEREALEAAIVEATGAARAVEAQILGLAYAPAETQHQAAAVARGRELEQAGDAVGVSIRGDSYSALATLQSAVRRQSLSIARGRRVGVPDARATDVASRLIPLLVSEDATQRTRGNLLLQDLVRTGDRGALRSEPIATALAVKVVSRLEADQLRALTPGTVAALMFALCGATDVTATDAFGRTVDTPAQQWSFVGTGSGRTWQVTSTRVSDPARRAAMAKLTANAPSGMTFTDRDGRLERVDYDAGATAVPLKLPHPKRDDSLGEGWDDWSRRLSIGVRYWGLRQLLRRRLLSQYGNDAASSKSDREAALSAFADALDFHANGTAFRDDLHALAGDDRVGHYLDALELALMDAKRGKHLRLFELTRGYAGSDAEAVRWLAVLLQDTMPRRATDNYWDGEVPQVMEARFADIAVLLAEPSVRANLDPYPPGVAIANTSFYHYYTPAYLTARLMARGIAPGLAAATATAFNAEYELNQYDVDTSTRGTWMRRIGFFENGPTRAADMSPLGVEEVYAGYLGAAAEAGRTPMARATFETQWRANPQALLHAVFATK